MVEGRDEDEWRKRLTAKLREIPSIVLIDNLRRQLDTSSVAAADRVLWEDRVLGKSEMVRFPIRCVWIATGNNPQFSNEIARRMVRIRLDPHEDQPSLREGFRHPNLLAWVWRTAPAWWLRASPSAVRGSPPGCRGTRDDRQLRGLGRGRRRRLELAGVAGFLGNLKELDQRANAEGGAGAASSRLVGPVRHPAGLLLPIYANWRSQCGIPMARGDEHAKRTSLGKALGRMRDRIYTINARRLRVHHVGSAHGAPAMAAAGLRIRCWIDLTKLDSSKFGRRNHPHPNLDPPGEVRSPGNLTQPSPGKNPSKINAPVRFGEVW